MTVVAMFTLLSPVSSTMVAPALGAIAKDFGIKQEFLSQLTLSIFILAYAVGPLFLGPISEMYGRAIVLQLANIFYLVFNIACGFARNEGQLIAFRFLSGLGGSVPVVVSQNHVLKRTYIADKLRARSVQECSGMLSALKNEAQPWPSTAWLLCLVQQLVQSSEASFLSTRAGVGSFMRHRSLLESVNLAASLCSTRHMYL